MKRRTRYAVLFVFLVALVALMLALPFTAMAKEGNNGNHEAVWAMEDVPMHNYDSGAEWGDAVSDWTTTKDSNGLDKGGVSEGVHIFKENGWNK